MKNVVILFSSILWCSTPLWFLALKLVENIPSLQFHHGVLTELLVIHLKTVDQSTGLLSDPGS